MGAAMGGLRPVAEIMFADFYATCWDQVANEIAKVRYMTGGQVSMPLVLRGANGSGGLRYVLGLHEGVVVSMADGYARVTGGPAWSACTPAWGR